MKVLICGLGSIGLRHAKILSEHLNHEVYAYRRTGRCVEHSLNIREIYSWDDVETLRPDVAFITNPTFLHIETALQCAVRGMHLFIEKSLSHSLDNIDLLESLCSEKGLTCYIAYCLRFHPVITKIHELIEGKKIYHARIVCSSFLPAWRPESDYTKSYSASSREGGGVLLDLSHEFDYAQYLFGEIAAMTGVYGRVSELTVDAEDFADVLVTNASSIPVNVHLNFNSLLNERTVTVVFEDGYATGDLIGNKVDVFYRGNLDSYEYPLDRDRYLTEQSQYFFDNIGNQTIMNNLAEAKGLLSQILRFKHGNKLK
ncbi:MAG: Gfo/Idh/MocA family oxidoreductase [Pseudomonadota bacterium]